MEYNKFKVGDLVKWTPNEYNILAGDKKDTGIVIEVGEMSYKNSYPLQRYALINWVLAGKEKIIYNTTPWKKTEIIARGNNV